MLKTSSQAFAGMVEMLVKEAMAKGGALAGIEPDTTAIQLLVRKDPAVPGGWAVSASAVSAMAAYADKIQEWLNSGDTGISSEAMCYALSNRKGKYFQMVGNWPRDNADLGRCIRLLDRIPEWRQHLKKVAEVFPVWKPMIEAWPELEAFYREEHPNHTGNGPKLYARMQELSKKCYEAQE